jgi:hypothetical protein
MADYKNLRLLVTENCNRNCPGCCNKDWNLKALPVVRDFTGYRLIMLTGGEPLTVPFVLKSVISDIRKVVDTPIVIYTAMMHKISLFHELLSYIDGVTLTIHEPEDIPDFMRLCDSLTPAMLAGKSMRLNIFKGCTPDFIPSYWKVRADMEWMKDCPLPENEVFMQL